MMKRRSNDPNRLHESHATLLKSKLPNPETLALTGSGVADLWPLSALPSLRRLAQSGNAVADAAALADLPLLRLGLSGNRLTSLDAWAASPACSSDAGYEVGAGDGSRWSLLAVWSNGHGQAPTARR